MGYDEKIRKSMGYTQAQLAELLGVDRSTLANWEVGRKHPTMEAFKNLSKALHVSIDYLIDGIEMDTSMEDLAHTAEAFFMSKKVSLEDKNKMTGASVLAYLRKSKSELENGDPALIRRVVETFVQKITVYPDRIDCKVVVSDKVGNPYVDLTLSLTIERGELANYQV